jgi:Interleukin-like EMT inducer
MSANGIAHLSTRELRQKAKLDLAATKRAARAGHRDVAHTADDRHTLDITELPTQYNNNSIIDNDNSPALLQGRPWTSASAFTFYEAFGTTNSLATTQYVSGNKIYAYSSTYDVIGYQNALVIVNGITVLNVSTRGHNMVVLNPYGDVVSTTNFDTYGVAGQTTALASALNGVANGNTVVLVVYDASALDSGVRTALNTHYGSTNSNTWTASRVDQIFIGIKS